MMRYMNDLNTWLARDLDDRQREIRSLGAGSISFGMSSRIPLVFVQASPIDYLGFSTNTRVYVVGPGAPPVVIPPQIRPGGVFYDPGWRRTPSSRSITPDRVFPGD